MIKEILALFKSDTLMDRAYERSFEMLDKTHIMFQEAKNVLRETEENNIEIDIHDEDNVVNKYQREVRRDVFSHLVVSGSSELSSGLALVSIVIDLERIGDYTKNIVSTANNYEKKLTAGIFEERLVKIEEAVEDSFIRTIEVFKNADEDTGLELIKEYKWVSKESDAIIDSLIREEDSEINSGKAAALVLYVRSLKRVHAHLRNVVTSVVNPFHRIGFKPKKKKN